MHRTLRRTTLPAVALAAALLPSGAGASIASPVASLARPGTLEVDSAGLVVTQAGPTRASLLTGTLDDPPAERPTIGMPVWARPHLGTSASGRRVVVYPSCRDTDGGCDLRVIDLASGRDTLVAGASTKGRDELEGDMDRGAVTWLVGKEVPAVGDIPGSVRADVGSVHYRPRTGRRGRCLGPAAWSSRSTAGRILLVRRSFDEGIGGEGGAVIIDLLRTNGQRTRLTAMGSGEDFQRIEGPRFVGKRLVSWAMVSASGTWLKGRSIDAGAKTTTVRVIKGGMSVSPQSRRAAYVLQGGQWASWTQEDGKDVVYPAGPFGLVRVTGLNPAS